jgi:hypothetical protein
MSTSIYSIKTLSKQLSSQLFVFNCHHIVNAGDRVSWSKCSTSRSVSASRNTVLRRDWAIMTDSGRISFEAALCSIPFQRATHEAGIHSPGSAESRFRRLKTVLRLRVERNYSSLHYSQCLQEVLLINCVSGRINTCTSCGEFQSTVLQLPRCFEKSRVHSSTGNEELSDVLKLQ